MDRLGFLLLTVALQGSAAFPVFAQSPARTAPSLAYTLSIDTADLSGYSVSIRVYHAPHRFHLAMATHHEYDDRQSSALWFSEGVTMLYADLICRRLGLHVEDSTRIAHLTSLITRYYTDTGNAVLAPSRVSLASTIQPGPLGDYSASTHLQGELLGACLDILIRDATKGRQSLDGVMREMYRRFGGHRPFGDSDIEAAVTTVCGCTTAHAFFRDFLYDGKPIDFIPWLDRLGLSMRHDQPAAADPNGRPLPDTRIYSWIRRDDTSVRIGITHPNGCWALAGLHTGDILVRMNGRPIHTRQDFQAVVGAIQIGDEIKVDVKKEASPATSHTVYITGYTIPLIHISQNPAAAPAQQRLLEQWLDTSR
jgi:predicted metalloprotease with PDZ domain